jgi:hypothetical protein
MPRCAITAVTRWRSEFLSILVLSAICAKLIITYYMSLSVEKYHFSRTFSHLALLLLLLLDTFPPFDM